jgi:hypothetical protein
MEAWQCPHVIPVSMGIDDTEAEGNEGNVGYPPANDEVCVEVLTLSFGSMLASMTLVRVTDDASECPESESYSSAMTVI